MTEQKGESEMFTVETEKDARLLDLGRRLTARGNVARETLNRFAWLTLAVYEHRPDSARRYLNGLVNRDFSPVRCFDEVGSPRHRRHWLLYGERIAKRPA
jgi:hypothetical protein